VRDWYALERGIDLPDFERFDEWWKRGMNLYLDNFGSAGFEDTNLTDRADLKVGDALLMQVASPVPNHAAVYLGDGLILHHLQGRLSSRDVYGGYWQKVTTQVLRHRDLHPHL
jgi:cell wall-associated NlpC family hydrolase